MSEPQLLATSGGMVPAPGGRPGWRFGALLRHALSLSGAARPKLCFVGTATGDNDGPLRACYGACAGEEVQPSHLGLFPMPNVEDVRAHLLAQDVVWVGGGSVVNLLAVWRAHGLDAILREAWEAGVVLGGVSAGSICWHVGGTTDSFGPELRPVHDGLGFVPYGNGVHYDSEPQRRPLLQQLVAARALPASHATDDGAGLHYVGTELAEAVCDRPGALAWRVEPDGRGGAREVELPTRLLPETTG
jgi:peptidase E